MTDDEDAERRTRIEAHQSHELLVRAVFERGARSVGPGAANERDDLAHRIR
jgi:hypothetical protein